MRGGTELCIQLDDLVNSINEISLSGNLAPRADGKHSGLGADAVNISTYNKNVCSVTGTASNICKDLFEQCNEVSCSSLKTLP